MLRILIATDNHLVRCDPIVPEALHAKCSRAEIPTCIACRNITGANASVLACANMWHRLAGRVGEGRSQEA